ncbi:hypothetical protein H4J57_05530 [Colwellia sp. BRX8-7]|uniref:hypothetical protein n=1 Tax=Colwellia sp. BRX8-7 TaxID=2759833 RepID=UPI0015F51159|nr:hypothetical protein [Colwellia sp. BRX8-7]MBA6336660.1 hypothetical protein [Colwellia sp. BRX8-7]
MPVNENDLASFAKEDLTESIKVIHTEFSDKANDFELPHTLTRRLASIASLMIVFGLLTLAGNFSFIGEIKLTITNQVIMSKVCSTFEAFNINIFDLLVVLFLLAVSIIKLTLDTINYSRKTKKSILINCLRVMTVLLILSILTFKWNELAPHALFWGLLIFIISYSSNRKYGYTRGYSRNRLYAKKVELLYADKLLGTDTNEDKNIRLQLHELIKKSHEEIHKDIVGDYIEYGNSALKWLSTKK